MSAPTTRRRCKTTVPTAPRFLPSPVKRRFRHDTTTAVDLFSGFGGLTKGIRTAGFDVIMAANHREYKVRVHEANHPEADHWIADLVDKESADYHDVRQLPAADLLAAGVSCVNHSQANSQRAYAEGLSLFDLPDPARDAAVTKSEKDRATANCVLHYAAVHHPRVILVECTTGLQSWGPAIPGRKKVGDGSTFRWWLRELEKLGYRYRILYLNSMFFGVPQSRNRLYIAFWDEKLPTPDLDHRPHAWCGRCDTIVEGVWSWKTGVPPSGTVEYGKQYNYRCPSCRSEVVPPSTPSLHALDLTDLGTRIGDRPNRTHRDGSYGPLAAATLARAERCRQRFADFPAIIMPAKSVRGVERTLGQPLATQTSQQEAALLTTGVAMAAAGNAFEWPGSNCRSRGLDQPLAAQTGTNGTGLLSPPIALAVDNYQGSPRGAGDPLPTQVGSETLGLVSAGVVPMRANTLPTVHGEAMPTVTAEQTPGLLTTGALFGGWYKQNGSEADATAPHPLSDPLGSITSRDTTGLLMAEWRAALADVALEDCLFRMMKENEVGRGCGFDVDFPGHDGTFVVWGSASDQVDGYGNAVSPQVGEWLGLRLRAILHAESAA